MWLIREPFVKHADLSNLYVKLLCIYDKWMDLRISTTILNPNIEETNYVYTFVVI